MVDPLAELQDLLKAVEPSRAFTASIRAQLEMQPVRRSARWPWWTGAVAALATAAALFVAVRASHWSTRPADVPRQIASGAAPSMVPPAVELGSPAVAVPVAPARPAEPVAPEPVVGEVEGHQLLVPADQFILIQRILGSARSGNVRLQAVPLYDQDGLLLAPAPLVLTPLPALVPLDIDSPTASSAPKADRKDNP